jgi:hypothetical protein
MREKVLQITHFPAKGGLGVAASLERMKPHGSRVKKNPLVRGDFYKAFTENIFCGSSDWTPLVF